MFLITMAFIKIFIKSIFLNYLVFSKILFAITINAHKSSAETQENLNIPKVLSHRSASFSCCKKWINHLRDHGLKVVYNLIEVISEIKNKYQIPNNLRSFHSAEIINYTIEGLLLIESINKLFREKSNIMDISFPVMPFGSPEMEMHSHVSHFSYYEINKVVSFNKTGKTKIFDKVSP